MKTTQQFLKKPLFLSLLLLSLGIFSLSFTSIPTKSSESIENVEYVDGDLESLTFCVNLPQVPEKGCILRITNESDEIFFEQRIKTKSYKQVYKIARNNFSKIRFTAIGKDFRVVETFNLRFVVEEKIEVTKL